MNANVASPAEVQPVTAARILNEGFGEGAWHGPDLKAALADVSPAVAFRRPGPGRHNIAEIALHHAYAVRNVRARVSGTDPGPFPLEGEDWFELEPQGALTWPDVRHEVESEHRRLVALLDSVRAGTLRSPLDEKERLELALGVTCHAVYHAGQVQLIKRLEGV